MKQNFFKFLFGAALACTGLAAKAQGLEGIVVEDYYTISAADANYLNNTVGVSFPINTGAKVYRIYVDMLPNYKLNTVNGSPLPQGGGPSPNPLDFTTTTTFWNDDNFGTEVPPQTARFDDGAAFDSYITVGISGRSGGAVGCGANTQQAGTLKTADTNGNLTLCSVYSGFPSGAGTPDGNVPPSATIPALTYNLGGLIDFSALTADGSSLVVVGDAWATLPNGTGVDGAGTNRVLIAQLTTDGALSFHINVQLQAPGGALETYVWSQAGAGEVVSSLLTYPQAGIPDCLGVIGGTALPGTPCNDNNVCTINDVYTGTAPNCGCAGIPDNTDTDGDGIPNCSDNCPTVVGQIGSACNDNNACTTGDVLNASCVCAGTLDNTDTDGDGVPNCSDNCPTVVGQIGSTCNDGNACTTGDVLNASCVCTGTLNNTDTDGDGIPNCSDNCPTVAGQIGSACNDNDVCTINDVLNASCACVGTFQDTDGDGTCNANDGCPTDPNKIAAGQCGCGVADTDTDGDGVANCNDNCPTVVGQIGSACDDGNINTTGDVLNASCVCLGSTVDCNDNDPCTIDSFNGTICVNAPGPDADGDGTCDLIDGCPNDPNKIAAGICGCGVADTDTDGDGTANCNDGCPTDPNKIAPGICGCGVADTDTDGDGAADCVDSCPNLTGQIGSPCDDGNINTTGDVINGNCVCIGSTVDCNDNDPCTLDSFNGTICVNTPLPDTDGDGTCDLTDGCATDPNKIAPGICGCGFAEPGTACDDNNAGTVGDVINANCVCIGTPLGVDCEGTPGGSALPGTACNDNNPNTGSDTWSPNCVCIGLPFDCLGVAGGTATIGSACNDGNVCTTGDVYNANCVCAGTVVDTDGDGVCDANDNCPAVTGQIGSACDDGNANTGPDALNASCQCVGPIIGGCTENLTLSMKLDGNPTQTTWTLLDAATETVTIASGGFTAGQANTTVVVPICVPVGCYHLRVLDSGNNGITNGGYVLRDASSRRIIDASLGSFTSVSQINTGTNPNRFFCVPISNMKMQTNSCDRSNQLIQSPVYCNTQPGANGYQFWIYDAHGTYNRRVVVTNPSLVPSTLLTDPVPTNVNLNIRVRSRIGTTFGEFGAACRIKFIPNNGGSGFRSMEYADEAAVASMTIYPNPNRDGQLTISMEGLEIADGANVDVVIYDLLGKPVVTETAPVVEGMLNYRMDLAGRLGQGMYVVNVTIDGELYTQRLVMQ